MAKNMLSSQFLQEIRELAARWGKIAAERATRESSSVQEMNFRDMKQFAATID
jgi:hypothetical protein